MRRREKSKATTKAKADGVSQSVSQSLTDVKKGKVGALEQTSRRSVGADRLVSLLLSGERIPEPDPCRRKPPVQFSRLSSSNKHAARKRHSLHARYIYSSTNCFYLNLCCAGEAKEKQPMLFEIWIDSSKES